MSCASLTAHHTSKNNLEISGALLILEQIFFTFIYVSDAEIVV